MAIQYIQDKDATQATEQLATRLQELLAEGKKVLWFVSGGSGGKVSANVSKMLAGAPLENLYVTLSDERYGEIGHADENWQILLDDGFSLPGATLYRPLIGENREVTTERFAQWIEQVLEEVDYVIGLFGMGADGHTAGIKPGSTAVASEELAAVFAGDDFERMTITPACIKRVDEAIVQAFGTEKHPMIRALLTEDLPLVEQPAQALKQIPRVTFYGDYEPER